MIININIYDNNSLINEREINKDMQTAEHFIKW